MDENSPARRLSVRVQTVASGVVSIGPQAYRLLFVDNYVRAGGLHPCFKSFIANWFHAFFWRVEGAGPVVLGEGGRASQGKLSMPCTTVEFWWPDILTVDFIGVKMRLRRL